MNSIRVLILGGTAEALELAEALAAQRRCEPILSLAGATRSPRLPPTRWRSGGFGGVDGLVDYLKREDIGLIISALHPFAAQMRHHALEAARRLSCPLLLLERPGWTAGPDVNWIRVADMTAAAIALGPAPRRVWLTIGRKELAPFTAQPQHTYLIRTVDPPPPAQLPARAELITARGPFQESGERELLLRHRIELIVTKDSGGSATEAKLHAARACGVPVIMVSRPPMPSLTGIEAHVFPTVAEMLQHVQALLAESSSAPAPCSIQRGV